MDFYIRQNSTEPILKLRLIDDGINDKSSFNDVLSTSKITFEMFEYETGRYQILNGECSLSLRTKKYNNTNDEYYIIYHFTELDTSVKGRFEGLITIEFRDTNLTPYGKLITPIKEKLYINVI